MNNNQITLAGHVGQDPRSKTFDDTGSKVVKFSIAVKEYSANKDEERTLWIDVDAWNGLGERVLKTITKGREVVLYGALSVSTFSSDQGGVAVQKTKPVIKLHDFYLCGKKPVAQAETPPEETKPTPKLKLTSAVR